MKLGLTGGIGSGKSVVGARLQALGAQLVDADALSRALTAPGGAAIPAIRQAWGDTMIGPDGAMDRARMRALAFADPAQRARLEALLHPLIGAAIQAAVDLALRGDARTVVVLDIPLLAESRRWLPGLDSVLVVDCDTRTQVQRVVARSGLAPTEVETIIAAQASRRQRRAIADHVLYNDGLTLDALHAQVDALWRCWRRQGRLH